MKKSIVLILFSTFVFALFWSAKPWGFWGHKRVNRIAVYTLPPDMFEFYKANIEYLTEHSVDPDKRRYAIDGEAPRHYIDIDHYGKHPFPEVPRDWDSAVAKFTEDTLQLYGILPWHLEVMLRNLTFAFKDKDAGRILKLSAEIGHYVGDAHVPLHTTKNYNGQLTNQKGIHGLWESRIPELFGENYDYFMNRAEYIDDVSAFIWETILASHICVDSVLDFERRLTEDYPSDKKYTYEERGLKTIKTYASGFCSEYSDMMGDMVERRLRIAIVSVGSFWLTAWIDAGKPDLSKMGKYEMTEEEEEEQKELDKKHAEGEIKGREHDDGIDH